MTHMLTRLAVLMMLFGLSGSAAAVSYPVVEEQREAKAAKGIREKGETVCLFQSGTADVKKMISVGDLITVYRESGKHELKEVGKIKVLSYIGEDYLKGEVIEGEVRTGDIAKKGDVASLVISSGDKCK
jgi:beta-lactam-binding protein with PASTA domain